MRISWPSRIGPESSGRENAFPSTGSSSQANGDRRREFFNDEVRPKQDKKLFWTEGTSRRVDGYNYEVFI